MAKLLSVKIRTERKKQNLTLEELADKAGVSKSYVWELEHRLGINPSVNKLLKIAIALHTTVDYLLDDNKTTMGEEDINQSFFNRVARLDVNKRAQIEKFLNAIEGE